MTPAPGSPKTLINSYLPAIRAEDRAEKQPESHGFDGPPARPQRFRFKSGDDNHIVCREWDGTNEGDADVLIALSYHARKSVVGTGYTYTDFQTRTRDGDSRPEALFPAFTLNDEIFAVQVDGGTGVQVSSEELTWLLLHPVFWQWICS